MNPFKKPLFKELIIMSVILFTLHKIALHYHLYIPKIAGEFDSLVHFTAGVGVGIGSLWFYFYSGLFSPTDRRYQKFFLIALLSIIFVGFSWEVYEIAAGTMNVNMPGYSYDTFLDLSFDTLGTVIACIYAFNKNKKLTKQSEWKLNSQFTAASALQPEQI